MKPTLDELGVRYSTDQCSVYHNYLARLEPYLLSQPSSLKLLELGVLNGHSIRTWLDFLPDAEVHGVDSVTAHGVTDKRFIFHPGDCTDPELWKSLGQFNVIIDDATHKLAQVAPAYGLGFEHLEPGGIWIIEDTCMADYDLMDFMRPTVMEMQDHNRDWCGNPNIDSGRIAFVHFWKGLIIVGRK